MIEQYLFDTAYSAYPDRRNKTFKWLPSDTEEKFNKNKKDPDKSKLLDELGYTHDNVEYRFNSAGFRSDEFSDTSEKSVVFLGCSHVVGIGINYKDTMAYQVSKSLSSKCYNLGIGAGSIDSCFRFARQWIPKIKPNIVVLSQPNIVRFETFFWKKQRKNPFEILNQLRSKNAKSFTHLIRFPFQVEEYPHMVDFYEGWTKSKINMELHLESNTLAIKQICNDNKAKFVKFYEKDIWLNKFDLARDLSHFGVIANEYAADIVLDAIDSYDGNSK